MLAHVSSTFCDALKQRLPASCFPTISDKYLSEPRGRYHAPPGFLITPDSTAQVATIIGAAAQARVGIIPYGGGTGLVGGQIQETGPTPIILSLERMRQVRAVYPSENTLVVDAGCVLADVQAAAQRAGKLFPLSLASEGSAQIGGLLATNAGGVNVLRYGMARDQVLGVEAVMADGTVLHGLKRLHKDNTGYDLRNLLVGSEGTLGIITAASLKLVAQPAHEGTAILTVDSPAAALDLLNIARDQLGDGITAFELISAMGPQFLAETDPGFKQPWDQPPQWSVLMHLGLPRGQSPNQAFESLFETSGLIRDGVIAQSQAQGAQIWALRERIPLANRAIGSISSHDISLPLSHIADFIPRADAALAKLGSFRINCFGHLGDGNLHYNVFPPKGRHRDDFAPLRTDIKSCVHDLVHQMQGSMSAEHGIGRAKVADLQRYGDPGKLAAMRAIKTALDPHGILNPGAILPIGAVS